MYYFTPDTIAQANRNINTLNAKNGGLLCVLSCLTENIEENKSYTIDGTKLRRELSEVFDKVPKKSFDNVNPSYIIFAIDWSTTFFNKYIKNKVDLLSCAVFFLRRQGFERELTKEEVIDIFIKRYNLTSLKNSWFGEETNLQLEYNQIAVEDNQAAFYKTMGYSNDFKSILFDGVIQKYAYDLKAAGQIQTLYAGSGVQSCFLLSDEPLNQYYIMNNEKLTDNNQSALQAQVDDNINLESEFRAWLKTIKKSDGEPYSANTINQYMSAIKAVPNDFADAISPYITVFSINNTVTFNIVKSAIEAAENYAQVNHDRGNGALSACLDLYGKFLEYKIAGTLKMFTPEWFRSKASDFANCEIDSNAVLEEFNSKFSVEILSSLSGEELLNTIFLNQKNSDNLCHYFEYDSKCVEFFGSIAGGFSNKYGLYYSAKNNAWIKGQKTLISRENAIEYGTHIRDCLVAGAEAIKESGEIKTITEFQALYSKMLEITDGFINKMWFMKYYEMVFPTYFATTYSDLAQSRLLSAIGEPKESSPFVRMGQMKKYADKCGITPVLLGKIFWTYYTDEVVTESNIEEPKTIRYDAVYSSQFARNRIAFGAPGTGKSFTLNKDKNGLISENDYFERVTFHPDYTYAHFVGTYKPVPVNEDGKNNITYKYVAGPFMRTLVEALNNSEKPCLLLIEEINRAQIAAVFGDIFQLLDRTANGVSEYEIATSEDMRSYLSEKLNVSEDQVATIKIPSNMFIWATMNSADQGVYPMDTAFKRRWEFEYIGIDDEEKELPKTDVAKLWNTWRKAINNYLSKCNVNEDKLMGPFFISKELMDGNDEDKFLSVFKNKVIMYLFEDAGKRCKDLFAGCSTEEQKRYSAICKKFDEERIKIFHEDIWKGIGD